jgi:hydrogenase maturation protease
MSLPDNVRLYDCGTSGIAVLEALDGVDRGIIIDAVYMGGEPGSVYRFSIDDILNMEDNLFRLVSLHQFDLVSTLKFSQHIDTYKIPSDIVVIGVEGRSFEYGLELSKDVETAIPVVIKYVLDEINR